MFIKQRTKEMLFITDDKTALPGTAGVGSQVTGSVEKENGGRTEKTICVESKIES